MLEFVNSDLYFVQDKNDFINPLLQVGSSSGSVEIGTGSGGPKSTDPTGSGSSSLKKTRSKLSGIEGIEFSIHRQLLDVLFSVSNFRKPTTMKIGI